MFLGGIQAPKYNQSGRLHLVGEQSAQVLKAAEDLITLSCVEHVNGVNCGTDRALTPLADGILKVMNRPVIGVEDLKCAGEQQGVAKIVWHGMPPIGCVAHM